jgi:outer membrane protein OmpU
MKKLLLASAAMALSAGVASAQGVTITGDARMGIEYNDNRTRADAAVNPDGSISDPIALNTEDFQFTSRARVIFTLSGETDTGMTFGASFRADQSTPAVGNTEMSAGTVFISGSFGRLTMGDAAGAARARVGDLAFTSLTGIGDWNEMGYLDRFQQSAFFNDPDNVLDITKRRTAVRYDYTFEGFTFSIGLDQLRSFENLDRTVNVGVQGWSAGASYNWDNIVTASIGYESLELKRVPDAVDVARDADHWIFGLEGTFSGITLKAIYGMAGGELGDNLKAGTYTNDDQWGVSATGTWDMITASAFYRTTYTGFDQYGIGASYNLGGGASIVGSIAQSNPDNPDVEKTTRADFGVAMRF